MSFQTMSDHAAQVIVGRVESVRSYWSDQPRRIETEVTFLNVEYLKGGNADSPAEFALVVPGGVVGQTQMRILEAPTFEVGERWLLFLLPSYKTFPVVGVSQGALRIERDAEGVERISSASGRRLTAIDANGFPSFGAYGENQPERLQGRLIGAMNARVEPAGSSAASAGRASRGMTHEGFRATIGPIIRASRVHNIAGPAGRRVPAEFMAVPLKTAAAKESSGHRAQSAPAVSRSGRRPRPVNGQATRAGQHGQRDVGADNGRSSAGPTDGGAGKKRGR